jgi:hypothetical protein
MLGNNGHGPILSEAEIKFLLSDRPIPDTVPHHARRSGETKAPAEDASKEAILDNQFAVRQDSR